MMMKKSFLGLMLLCCVAAAQALVVLETDFDGAVPNAAASDLDDVTWTADEAITADTTITSVSGHELSNITPLGQTDSEWADNVGVNYNLNTDRPTPRGIVASFSVTSNLSLDELVIGHTQTTNSGTLQAYDSDMTVTLTNVTDGIVLFTDTAHYDYNTSPRAWQSHAYDLSGISLDAGKDYTITLTMQDMIGGGAYATWNLISLNDARTDQANTPVPTGDMVDPLVTTSLQWSAPTAYTPVGYDLVFRKATEETEPNFLAADNLVEITDQSATSPYPVTLANDTTYYWRVDAYEPNDSSLIRHEGEVWTFTTIPAEPVITTQPAGETAASVDLFIEATNAEQYIWYRVGTPDIEVQNTVKSDPNDTCTVSTEGYYYCVVSNTAGSDTSEIVRVMTPRLVAHWKFDGDLTDSSLEGIWEGDLVDPNEANENPDDSLLNYAEGVDGTPNGAADFDGTYQVLIPDSNEFFTFYPQGLTLTAWVKGPYVGTRILAKGYNFALDTDVDGLIHNSWISLVPGDELAEDKWRLVAMTYDPAATEQQYAWYSIYDDTDVVDILHTTAAAGAIGAANNTYHLYLGGNYNVVPLDGLLDDVRIYNYALTATELQQLYSEMTSAALCMNIDDPSIEYDYNGDCEVTLSDFASFAAAWLNSQLQGP